MFPVSPSSLPSDCTALSLSVPEPVQPIISAVPAPSPDSHVDADLAQLLQGAWSAQQFDDMVWSLRQWARRSAGLRLVHDPKETVHRNTCPRSMDGQPCVDVELTLDSGTRTVHFQRKCNEYVMYS